MNRVLLIAVILALPAAARAIPQPPHSAGNGIECLDCHVPYASLQDPARSTGQAGPGSDATTLTDPAKAWTDDEWAGGVVTFTSGPSTGQYRTITGNGAALLRWDLPLAVPLAAGDTYRLGKTTHDDLETKCRSCHNPAGQAAAMSEVGLHRVRGGQVIGCGDCHDPHNVDPNTGAGHGLLRRDLRWPASQAEIVFPSGDPNPYLDGPPGYDGICETCHAATRYHRRDATGDHRHNADVPCTGCHPHDEGFLPAGGACNACHGSEQSPAPPRALSGSEDTADVEVGSHRAHLGGGTMRGPVACEDCHVVPGTVGDDSHLGEAPAEITFSGLALADGGAPTWDRLTARCSDVYCHGATLGAGGTITAPRWTTVDGTQDACGTCHGAPPPAPHPDRADCHVCHPDTVDDTGRIDLAGGRHIDGQLDLGSACNTCHGADPARPAPPPALDGSLDTSARGVGAHARHLDGGLVRGPMACEECHVVPNEVGAPGHLDASPADLTFGALATAGGLVVPRWDPASERCSDVYCHGALSSGGAHAAPRWTQVDGLQAACGACHGNPPPAPHPPRADCDVCHFETVRPDGTIDLAAGQHVDGDVDVGSDCTDCHGREGANAAPPRALDGSQDPAIMRVGAHQRHLAASALRGPVTCDECHAVPAGVNEPGHLDAAPADLVFGALATAQGAQNPRFDRASGRCSDVYCHGSGTPVWNIVDGSQMACGTCHGNPPAAPHPPRADCNTCHEATVDAAGQLLPANGQHIDGDVDLNGETCDACHGSAQNPAPPAALDGTMDPADVRVGAHQAHLRGGDLRAPLVCEDCHAVPVDLLDVGHLDPAPADLTFGALARAAGGDPSWDRAAERCGNVYCHGATLAAGGTNTAPRWTRVDGSQDACGTCHGAPPPAPHPQSPLCSGCHPGTVRADGTIDVAGGLHVNGVTEVVAGDCLACHATAQSAGLVRRAIVSDGADFARPSHHVAGAPTVEDCEACHDQDQHMLNPDPEVLLKDADGAEPHTYDGQGASLEAFCLACHDADGAAITDTGAPFSDTLDPPDIAATWAGGAHEASPHPALADEGCLACHGGADPTRPGEAAARNVHGSDFASLLSSRVAGEDVANGEEALCLSCHDGGTAATNIAAEAAKAGGHRFAARTGIHRPDETLNGRRTHVECTDCHDPHGGALRSPAGGLHELCYGCHADPNQPMPTAIQRSIEQPSLAIDFDPANPSFHPVEGPGRSRDVPSLRPGWTVDSRVTCTDCHDNDAGAAGPRGPHGSRWPYLLARRYDTGDPSSESAQAYALCYGCHDRSSILNDVSFPLHSFHVQGEQATCSTCHDPHGIPAAQAAPDGGTHLINFDLHVVSPTSAGELWYYDDPLNGGACALSCHGYDHEPETY